MHGATWTEGVIREASPSDDERVRAFYASQGRADVKGDGDRVLIAESGGSMVGVVRLCPEEGVLVLRTMRVLSAHQRRGIGAALLARFADLLAGAECFCLAYAHLEGFYGQIGFRTVAPEALPGHLATRLAEYRRANPALIGMRRPPAAPSLETARLRLRPMAAADLDDMRRQWNDASVGRYLWDGRPVPRDTVEQAIASSQASFAARGFGLWTAWLQPEDRVVGFCGLRLEGGSDRVELLYALEPGQWGRGLATEAARAVLAYARERLRLPEVVAATNPDNVASWRVLEKVGMRRVGRRRTVIEELLVYSTVEAPV